MSFSILKSIMGQSVSEPEAEISAKKLDTELGSDNEKVVPEPETPSSVVSTESDTLEWKFTDLRKVEGCLINEVDAVMLKRFIGHNVTVTNLSRERFHGCCLAIDPVTLSVILAKRIPGNRIRVITLPGYHLAKISVDPNCVPVEEQVSVNDLDAAELYHSQTLYSERARISKNATQLVNSDQRENGSSQNSSNYETHSRILTHQSQSQSQPKPQITYTEDELKNRKESVMNMLRKHRMPVTENGNVLEMPGGVTISPPYTIESCDTKGNQVIKNKLGEMLTIECSSN